MADKLLRQIDQSDTTEKHKQALMSRVEGVKSLVGSKDPWSCSLVIRLLSIIGALLGPLQTLTFYRTPEQYHTDIILAGGDALQSHYDQKNAISIRREVIQSLRGQGLTPFKIALVLNTTEYAVKKLIKEIAPKRLATRL